MDLILWLFALPFKIVFGMLHFAFWLANIVLGVGLTILSVGFCLWLAKQYRLNPLLCGILGLFFPLGPLVVVVMAAMRSARAF